MRDYNYRVDCKRKKKERLILHRSLYFCRPRSPRLNKNELGQEYLVEGNGDNRKKFLKKQASKKARNNLDLSNGSCYKKTFALIYEWY